MKINKQNNKQIAKPKVNISNNLNNELSDVE